MASQLVLITVERIIPTFDGDYNHDSFVDAADYVVWRKTDGTPAAFNAWRAHFGEPAGSGAAASANAAVPEPATWVLLMFAVTAGISGDAGLHRMSRKLINA